MTDSNSKRTTRPLRYMELIDDHINSLISGRAPNFLSVIGIVKDELDGAWRALELIPDGVEKTERAEQIKALEEKFLEWEKNRQL